MSRYLLLMRGDQSSFVGRSEEEQKAIIADYIDYADELDKKAKMLYGDGCSYHSVLLKGDEVKQDPFVYTDKQLSGFYMIEAENDEEAQSLAKECPALKHGESVEVVKLGH
ncbi:MAG: hypothetical protein JXR69_10835 [Candidatus Delongbacteria bacterium]|nr:hypothetical protein [Candidatus Delongbacteria bacterium]